MATITKSIGTSSRDYSTLQAWEDAIPANLVSADEKWVGECYNDAEFSATENILTISGHTTDATRYIELTAAAGQSFQDHASVQSNALTYDATKGVGVKITNGYRYNISSSDGYTRIKRLQFLCTSIASHCSFAGANTLVEACIFKGIAGGSKGVVKASNGVTFRSCLIIDGSTGNEPAAIVDYGPSAFYYCTIVRSTGTPGSSKAIEYIDYHSGTSNIVASTAIFGFSAPTDIGTSTGVDATNSKNNATDNASGLPGSTGNQHSLTYASQFESVSADFRAKTGANLLDAGATDSTNGANDIAGTARPSGSAYDIGCWELVQSTATSFLPQLRRSMRRLIARR